MNRYQHEHPNKKEPLNNSKYLFDIQRTVQKTTALIQPHNYYLSNVLHPQGDTQQCWAYSLATMLKQSRTGMEYNQESMKFNLHISASFEIKKLYCILSM